MTQHIAQMALVVKEYAEAIDFYVGKLGFSLIEDTELEPSTQHHAAKRWVVVSPGESQCRLLLAQAGSSEEESRIGNQTGGRVFLFLYTDDFWRDYDAYKRKGVEFVRGEPREEVYGTVAVFRDLYGNLWDLIQPAR